MMLGSGNGQGVRKSLCKPWPREFWLPDQTDCADHLDLVLAKGYLARLRQVSARPPSAHRFGFHQDRVTTGDGSLIRTPSCPHGARTQKRGDRRRRRTAGRIKRGGGDVREPARYQPWLSVI